MNAASAFLSYEWQGQRHMQMFFFLLFDRLDEESRSKFRREQRDAVFRAISAYNPEALVVIGPEAPLVDGLADRLRTIGRTVLGPGADGALLEMEMFPDDDADPCEVYFSDYHEVEGRMLPGKIEVRYGDGIYQVFACKQFKFELPAEK